ncbi:uracil-DNA glycosylase [Metamycoplasma buccale]|uniref:uracil-DNA glycosylase n=1 Tax=Metamycoplasma buccale TaxID=55602 RepID=UPI00398F24E7
MKFNFLEFFNQEKQKDYFKDIQNFLKDKIYLPPKNKVFFAFQNFDFDNLKVVLIGQDPYPTKNVADGLCFSSQEFKTPASLKNMFIEIKRSYPDTTFKTNDLSYWKNQGILLLNRILTVQEGIPLSHKNIGWETFNLNILSELNKTYQNIIYLIFGNEARKFASNLDLSNQIILSTSHPSPLGVKNGFEGSNIFKKVNDELKKLNKKEIDWGTK